MVAPGEDDDGNDFPGESARASLKLRLAEQLRKEPADFPGESARASLKRSRIDSVPSEWITISRANQPGPH